MSWILKNKLFFLFIIAAIIYWLYNPVGLFGVARKGFVVYNRIPILFFDCYINPEGRLYLESDLTEKNNIRYWFDNHLQSSTDSSNQFTPLLIGNGFAEKGALPLTPKDLQTCRNARYEPRQLPSTEAIIVYNSLRKKGRKVAILLKIK